MLVNLAALKSIPLHDLASRWVELRPRGRHFVGICPFHAEKTPSLSVIDNRFHCFGCGADGDALDFVQRIQNMTLAEAARWLSKEYGIDIEEGEDPHARLRQVLNHLTNLFEMDRYVVQPYLDSRGITLQMSEHWRLGYSDNPAHPLMKEVGLLSSEGHFLMNHRLIFPICDRNGQVISMAGRVMPGRQGPKYINGQNSELYDKSVTLYGLHRAFRPIQERGEVILVEGYTDVILLHSVGVTNSVAACGTGITEGHLSQLSSITGRLVICTDPDEAGVKAALRTIGMAGRYNLSTEVLILQEDPADAVNNGKFSLTSRVPGFLFMKQNFQGEEFELITKSLEIVMGYKNFIKKDLEIKNLSNIFGVSIRALNAELKRMQWRRRDSSESNLIGSRHGRYPGRRLNS